MSKTGIVHIFVGDGTFMDRLVAAIANIRGLVQTAAVFPDKIFACLVTGGTGGALNSAKDEFATDIRFSTMISVDAEIMGIVESALVIPVAEPVLFDLFRNGRGILAEEAGNVFKGCCRGKRFFNVKSILQGKMFLIARYKIAHDFSFYCCQKAEESYHKRVKK